MMTRMPHDASIYIIYPEKRWVSAEQITSWYLDAVANGQVQNRHCIRTWDMAGELEDIGLITRGVQS